MIMTNLTKWNKVYKSIDNNFILVEVAELSHRKIAPKGRGPPIGMNENLSWWRAQKNGAALSFLFYMRRNDVQY